MIRLLAVTAIWFTFMNTSEDSQFFRRSKTKEFREGITISYKWKQCGFLKKDSDPRLFLKIRNENPHKVLVGFTVDYYWNTILDASSEKVQYCVKPHRKIRGKMWDLVFTSGRFSREQISDESFMWEISDFEIIHDTDCRTRLNIKIKPEIREMGQGQNETKETI